MYSHIRRACALALAIVPALAFLPSSPALADAENPVKAWTVEGLANPESAVFDEAHKVIYVSNVDGEPLAKDGKGFVSKVSMDGKVTKLRWVDGLNAPKGMAIHKGLLFVADIDQLVVIDISTAKIRSRHDTPGAKFLNDVAAGDDGSVFVSDMFTNTIHKWHKGQWAVWMQDAGLDSPNGLWHAGDGLVVACWGSAEIGQPGNGGIVTVSLGDKSISQFSKESFGHLDGLEMDIDGDFYVTDWSAGLLYHVELDGSHELLLELGSGSADIGYIVSKDMLLIPMMKDNVMHAYNMHAPVAAD